VIETWWRERSSRERAILIGGGVALLLVVIYLIMEPRIEERHRLAADIPQLQEDLAWMQRHVQEAKQLRAQGGKDTETDAGDLTPAVVEESLRRGGLADAVDDLRPAGDRGVEVAFRKVRFPKLAQWLHNLEASSGARVHKARIERLDGNKGVVKADLTLGREGGQ